MILIKASVRNPASYQFYGVLGPKNVCTLQLQLGEANHVKDGGISSDVSLDFSPCTRLVLEMMIFAPTIQAFCGDIARVVMGVPGIDPEVFAFIATRLREFFSMEIPLTFCTVYICIIFVYLPIFRILMNIEMWNLITCSPLAKNDLDGFLRAILVMPFEFHADYRVPW